MKSYTIFYPSYGIHFLTAMILLVFISCVSPPEKTTVDNGDRHPDIRRTYPEDAFYHNGGRIIDVTQPPFNAKGDGKTDDTEALIAAYDVVADAIRDPFWSRNNSSYIIYLPKGTYLVSNTIMHSLPRVDYGRGWSGVTRVRFIGESRDETVIRLKDNCPGYEAGEEKRVLSFQYEPGTNVPGLNFCANLTLNTGKGNPGAVAMMFHGANLCGISNISIKSEDGNGAVGLDYKLFSMQGHCKDITVSGFDYGIRVVPYAECNPSLEFITLENQQKAGVLVEDGSPSIRKLWSRNHVPALHMVKTESPAAQAVVIESLFEGGSADNPAIRMDTDKAQFFGRDIQVKGYGSAVQLEGETVLEGNIDEYVSGQVLTLFDEPENVRSLNLAVEEMPSEYNQTPLSEWANVDEFPGDTDQEKVQAAMNSGNPTVYFPSLTYDCKQIKVPASVEYIEFMYTNPRITLVVEESSDSPLFIKYFTGHGQVQLKSPRTLVMYNTRGLSYDIHHDQPNDIFLESSVDIGSSPDACGPGVNIWARNIDNENKNTANFKVYGGKMWVLGFKTEGHQAAFDVREGGRCEVLGGYRNETTMDEGIAMVINENSNVCFIGYSSMSQVYEVAVRETRQGETRKLTLEDVPVRADNDMFIPMYLGKGASGK